MATQHLIYKPRPVRAIDVSGATVKELCPSWQENVQETASTTTASKIGTRGIRMTLLNLYYSLLEILLPSRWEENNFDTSQDRRPAAPIHILGNSQVVFDARHRRSDRDL
jgi:hypothetical protein